MQGGQYRVVVGVGCGWEGVERVCKKQPQANDTTTCTGPGASPCPWADSLLAIGTFPSPPTITLLLLMVVLLLLLLLLICS